jgi:UDP-N-acetylglucosamine:LPS N-acetylglucosamine transferase
MKIMRILDQVLTPSDQLTRFKNEAHRRLEKTNYLTAERRFLFIIADSGGGHRTTANAVKAAILEQMPDACIYLMPAVDILNTPQRLFSRGLEEAYNQAIKMGAYWMEPFLFNSVYMMELPVIHQYIALRNAQIIAEFQPEAIVAFVPATQELTYHALQFLNKAKDIPLYTVITDMVSMRHNWIMPEQAFSFMPTVEAQAFFEQKGIPADKMQVTGLPVHPRFYRVSDSLDSLKQKYGLDPERFTLMILMGANGSQSIYQYCQFIKRLGLPIQIIACCGKSTQLKSQLERFAKGSDLPIHVFGFTREIDELMQVSDLLLTKPGSVSIAESIAQNLPLLIDASNYIMWQERGNDAYIEKHKIGMAFRSRQGLEAILSLLVNQPEKYSAIKTNIQNFPKQNATALIAEHLILAKSSA